MFHTYEVNESAFALNQNSCESQASQQARSSHPEWRERYEEQQRRLACPGCGEEPFID